MHLIKYFEYLVIHLYVIIDVAPENRAHMTRIIADGQSISTVKMRNLGGSYMICHGGISWLLQITVEMASFESFHITEELKF